MNLYAFVKNEPLMHFDEYGLHLTPRSSGSFSSSEIIKSWTQTAFFHFVDRFSFYTTTPESGS